MFIEFVWRISLTGFLLDIFQKNVGQENFNYPVRRMPSSWANKNAQSVEAREKLFFLTHNVLFVMEQENTPRLQKAI
jgi:hypothetical protein